MIKVLKLNGEVVKVLSKMPLSTVLKYKNMWIEFNSVEDDDLHLCIKFYSHCNNYILPCQVCLSKRIEQEISDAMYTRYLIYDTKNKTINIVINTSFNDMCDYFKYQFITLEDFEVIGGK